MVDRAVPLAENVQSCAGRTAELNIVDKMNKIGNLGGGVKRSTAVKSFRNRRGERIRMESVTATDAKKEFGRVLEAVMHGGAVVITKHDAPKAVLISVEEFNALSEAGETRLDTLSDQFDALLDRMQTPRARRGMKAAFEASPKQLGKAAIAVARRRG
jgi:prevent-host-death family protein